MDIGSLTGQASIEDQISDRLTTIAGNVKSWAEEFEGLMGTAALSVSILAAAVTGIAISITALGEKGSDINDVTSTLEHFAGGAEAAEETIAKMREGVKGTVGDFDLAKDASRLLSAGVKLSADQFGELTEAAFVLQNRGLGSTKDMMDLVSSAMVTGRTRALAMKLGVVEVKDTTEEYARSLGLLPNELNAVQQAEGKRIGILKMLESANRDAGVQQRDFGEQIEFAKAALENWVDELASAVAASPNVMRAVESIGVALQEAFGGDGKTAIETITGLINTFADGVTKYAPPIIKAIADIGHTIVELVTFAANHTGEIETFVLAWGTYEVLSHIGSGYAAIATGVQTAVSMASKIPTMSTGIAGLAAEVQGFGTTALAPFLAASAPMIAAVAGITAATVIGYQTWNLYSESTARAASAAKQATVDQSNMAIAARMAGHDFATLDEAVQYLNTHVKDQATGVVSLRSEHAAITPVIAAHSAAQKEITVATEAYTKKINAIVDGIRAANKEQNLTTDAFNATGLALALTQSGIEKYIPMLDKLIASGRALTETEKNYYETVTTSRLNILQEQEALLGVHKVTLEQIEALKAHGMSEAEMAVRLGTTIDALKAYQDQLKQVRDVERAIADEEGKTSETSTEQAIKAHKREFDDAVANLDKTSAAYSVMYDKLDKLRQTKDKNEGSSWDALVKGSQESLQDIADAASRDYDRMIDSSYHFSRDALDAQLQKVRETQAAANGMGGSYVTAFTNAAAAAQTLKEKTDAIAKAAADAHAAIQRMGGSFAVPTIDVTDQNRSSLQEELARIKQDYAAHPGRMAGGSGDTGVTDQAGWTAMLAEQTRYQSLMNAVGGSATSTAASAASTAAAAASTVKNISNTQSNQAPASADVISTISSGGGKPSISTIGTVAGNQVYSSNVSSGGVGVYNFNVYGATAEEHTRQIKDILMRDLKTSRQFSAA